MNSSDHSSTPSPNLAKASDLDHLSFPRLRLVVPSLAPVVVAGVAALTCFFGPRSAGIHSTSGGLLFALFSLSSIIAVVVELFTVPEAMRLLKDPILRTVPNILCVIIASGVLLLGVLWLLVQLLW